MTQSAVFWTDENNLPWMRSELKQGRLRQGWGIDGSQLVDDRVPIPYAEWALRYAAGAMKTWKVKVTDKEIRIRHGILMRMLQFRPGDQLVIPRMPDIGYMTLARVRKGYRFDSSHFETFSFHKDNNSDFGHVVDIDLSKLAEVGYNSSNDARFVSSKFRNYQSPITFARAQEYRAAIDRLFKAHLEV